MQTHFMLTKNDETIPDAEAVFREVAASVSAERLPYVGFKTVGLLEGELERLGRAIRADGRRPVVEIVGADAADEVGAARLARRVEADLLIGGTHVDAVLDALGGGGPRYFPTVGDVTSRPGRLVGEVDDLANQAAALEERGASGVMLLAYRYEGDMPALLRAVTGATALPVVCAGSVDGEERISALKAAGVWAFTIGSAVLDRKVVADRSLAAQLDAVLAMADGSVGGAVGSSHGRSAR